MKRIASSSRTAPRSRLVRLASAAGAVLVATGSLMLAAERQAAWWPGAAATTAEVSAASDAKTTAEQTAARPDSAAKIPTALPTRPAIVKFVPPAKQPVRITLDDQNIAAGGAQNKRKPVRVTLADRMPDTKTAPVRPRPAVTLPASPFAFQGAVDGSGSSSAATVTPPAKQPALNTKPAVTKPAVTKPAVAKPLTAKTMSVPGRAAQGKPAPQSTRGPIATATPAPVKSAAIQPTPVAPWVPRPAQATSGATVAGRGANQGVAQAKPSTATTPRVRLSQPVPSPQPPNQRPVLRFTQRQPAAQPAARPTSALPSGQAGPKISTFTAAQAGQPPAPAAPPAAGPFEVIDQSGELVVQVRRSKLLRTKQDIYRTAVVDPSTCDVLQFTPREVSVIGKSEGATHVTFWFDNQQQPVTYLIRVTPDVEAKVAEEKKYELLERLIADLFPDSKVRLILVADKLIVRGQAKDSEEATQIMAVIRTQSSSNRIRSGGLGSGYAAQVLSEESTGRRNSGGNRRVRVVNMLRVPGVQQVALRVKIAELNRTAARGFGVDLNARVNYTNNPAGSALFLQSLLNASTGNAPALLSQFDGDDIQVGIRWLSQHGIVRMLSEPTLVTMSGRPATFVAGGEFAVPTVVGTGGLNAVTTDFRAFGVIISFVPTVIDKDRVRLQVAPEFSQVNQSLNVGQTPGLNVRAVTTTVEMREGQTLAIAGLLEDTYQGTNVGDLPLVSRIFGRRDANRNETELLILVTPELVHAMEPEEVPPLPGFDVTEPNNKQFYLHGAVEGNPTREHRSTVWPRLRKRYKSGGPAMISGPFGHGQ